MELVKEVKCRDMANQKDIIREHADIAWLGLSLEDIKALGPGPLIDDIWGNNDSVPINFMSVLLDPNYFAFLIKNVFNIELLPMQHAMLIELWSRPFPMLIASRGYGKSFMLGLYALLRALLHDGCKIVIVGAGFRQAKVIYEYVETIWNNAPLLQDICSGSRGSRRDVDRCTFFLNKSQIIAVPLGDGSKVRGLRANYIIADEFASIPSEVYETVIAGFASVSAAPIDNVKLEAKRKWLKENKMWNKDDEEYFQSRTGNQAILSGTASYSFNHFYDYWKTYHTIITSQGNPSKLVDVFKGVIPDNFNWRDYSIMRIPYELIPLGFMDEKHVSRARATVQTHIYLMEYGACYSQDSTGFFKRSLIESCITNKPIVLPSGPVQFDALVYGHRDRQYVYGIDPASERDNFSIVVLELHGDHRRVVYCWTATRKSHRDKLKAGNTSESDFYSYCARKIRDLMKTFPCARLGMDTQGGQAVEEDFHNPKCIEAGESPIWPIIREDKPEDSDNYPGLHILDRISFSDAKWVGEANHGLKKDMEDKVLLYPIFDPILAGLSVELEDSSSDNIEDCMFEIEEMKAELTTIVKTETAISGRDRWDTPEIKIPGQRKGRMRKDRYTALLIANMCARQLSKPVFAPVYEGHGGFIKRMKPVNSQGTMFVSGPEKFRQWAEKFYRRV
jgi:hypothetical protein